MLLVCLLAPRPPAAGCGLGVLVLVGWLAACAPPRRVVWGTACAGVAGTLPVGLAVGAALVWGTGEPRGLAPAVELVARGTATALVTVATATTLPLSQLRVALATLPVPSAVAAVLLQIVQQTGALLEETGRVMTALAVRGAGRGGVRWAAALPRTWLPRLLSRAERVATAMEVRELGEAQLVGVETPRGKAVDGALLWGLAGLVGLAAALRWAGGG